MKINWINRQASNARSVALGTFDGVHRGHQQLLQAALTHKPKGGTSCVFTFNVPPEQFFRGQSRLVTSFERKVELILEFGIDEIAWLPFNKELASLEASEFVRRILVEELQVSQVICGFDFRFGHKRSGDVAYLQEQGSLHGFEVSVVSPFQDVGGEIISSTAIRNLIAEGSLARAAQYLGYFPSYKGVVVHGAGRGHQLGFPTANLQLSPELVLPGEGVYLTWCILPSGQGVPAVTSIGRNPTFDGTVQTVEAFILDFTGDLYDQTLEIQFLEKIREIERYDTTQQLQAQIDTDVATAKGLLPGFRLQESRIVLK